MSQHYQLNVQLTEHGKNGDYSLTGITYVPNTKFKTGKIELVSKKEKMFKGNNDIEIKLHVSSGKIDGLHNFHDSPLVWQTDSIQLGKDLEQIIVHLVLEEKYILSSLFYRLSDEDLNMMDYVESKKQKISELGGTLDSLKQRGLDPSILLLKQKQKGC